MSRLVPNFFVYGEPDRPIDTGFIHVEAISERWYLHYGVAAAHKHDRLAQITFWTRGGGRYRIEDQVLDFTAPAVSFIPSGIIHAFSVEAQTSDALVISVADGALPPIRALSSLDTGHPVMVRGQPGHPQWQHLSDIMHRTHADYRNGNARALAALTAVAMNDIALLAEADSHRPQQGPVGLAMAFRRFVDLHFREGWSMEQYVVALGTTSHLLARACHAAFGQPPKACVDDRRLLEAKRLLQFTIRPVEDIGYEIGFEDPAYFSRFFRRRTGKPPGEWRKAQEEQG